MIVMTGTGFGQYKTKKLIIPIANRASTFGTPIKVGDFIYIEADSALYMAKVAMSATTTGTYMMASPSRYAVAKFGVGISALTATTGTFSSTLGVTGTTTLAGALNAAGAIGFGTSNNKFTVAAATGNTAIAGTLGVTGVTTIQGQTLTANHVNNLKAGNSLTATDSLFGPVTSVSTKLLVGSQEITQNHTNNVLFSNSVTATDTVFGPVTKAATKLIVGTIPVTASTGKIYADSLSTKRILVSDTLQGLVIYTSTGTKYRLRVSPTGVLSIVAVP